MGWKGILGFEYGIVQAPLGPDIAGPELVAAVANAGGVGLLRAPDWESPEYVKELIRKTRKLTHKPFGVGVILAFPHKENIKAILEEKVAVLQLYWGECSKELAIEAHNAGVKVVPQVSIICPSLISWVGSFEEAKKAINVGVDAIIVQGREAGGHVIGQDALISLLPRVVDLVGDRDISVIAAGAIVDARGYVAALALGAKGICMGTRFLATHESYAHSTYKQKLIELDKTEYTDVFGRARWPGAPHRVLQTPFFCDWKSLPAQENESNQPIIGRSVIHGVEREIRRFAGTVPNPTTTGDIESMVMYAGQSVGLIKEIIPAAEVVKRVVEGAKLLIHQTFSLDSV
ncbi:NADH:quinone reductase-like isoform X2 [Hibiscus syriacus]|uniref:NADH:quinone reductase-like isoform X2 n=1 Tax=Hibiscus syriacus TaxID=106335 RepID=UPI001921B659|nr:NADH:quinone reductase-like isoform X2 [Hibiscus syriacus]